MTTKASAAVKGAKSYLGKDLPRNHVLRTHVAFLSLVHFVLSCARIWVATTVPASAGYLVPSQAARDAACATWAMVFFSGFIFFGRYHRSTQSSRPNVFHMSTRLLGLGIYLILIVFVLIGNPLSVMLYNNGKPFFDGANHNFSPRALFLASIGVYVYSATTGVAMFIFASTWRTLKKRMAPL